MFKITVMGIGFTKKDKSDIKLYPFEAFWRNPKLKSDERFNPIGVAITGMEFPEYIKIALGVSSSFPLFVKINRIGNLDFSEPCNEENEGFLIFGGNKKILQGKTTAEIRKEFLEQFRIFLEQKSNDEFKKGIEFNKVSQRHFINSRSINQKLSSIFL